MICAGILLWTISFHKYITGFAFFTTKKRQKKLSHRVFSLRTLVILAQIGQRQKFLSTDDDHFFYSQMCNKFSQLTSYKNEPKNLFFRFLFYIIFYSLYLYIILKYYFIVLLLLFFHIQNFLRCFFTFFK